MSRFIDADKLKNHYAWWSDENKEIFDSIIDAQPTADVKEVVRGENVTKQHPVDEFICSNCGLIMRDLSRVVIDEEADNDESFYEFEFKYCPMCGADMRGGNEYNKN